MLTQRIPLLLLLVPFLSAQQPPATPQPAPTSQPADQPAPPPLPPPGQILTPNQLDGLVAPIALYPDPLVSQVLVASTYPREVTLAVRFMNQHPDLKGKALADASQDQNWDPSVTALLMFPPVLRRLNQDKVWTTNLGNAFLAQQADVMQAVQRMRRAAKAAGKLSTTRQMKVVETADGSDTVIELEPANPNVIFVPTYDPAWIWGPPLWYPYPHWIWGAPPVAAGVYFGYGPAIAVGAFYGPAWGVWGGWGGWGWRPGWVNRTVIVNNTFINNVSSTNVAPTGSTGAVPSSAVPSHAVPGSTSASGSPTSAAPASSTTPSSGGRITGTPANTTPTSLGTNASTTPASANAASPSATTASTAKSGTASGPAGNQTSTWSHNPAHRMGVPYPNKDVAQRFHAPAPNAAPLARSQTAKPHANAGARAKAQTPRARPAGAHAPAPRKG